MNKVRPKEIKIPKVGKLILSDKVIEYINALHNKVGALEWSGMLFYKIIEGDIKSMKDMVFRSDFIYPRNIGNATYTSTEAGGDISDAYDIYEDGIECSTGLIHTHHRMNAFFSGTDKDELIDNAKIYNYYLSLIVNFDGEYCAKIAFPGTERVNSTIEMTDSDGNKFEVASEELNEVVLIGDVDVEYNRIEPPVEEWLDIKIKELKEASKPKIVHSHFNEFMSKHQLNQTPEMRPSFANVPAVKKTATPKDLLANLIVTDPEAALYSDKTVFIAQELKALCDNAEFAEATMNYISENFNDEYDNLFPYEYEDEVYLKNLVGLLNELMVYDKIHKGSPFYDSFVAMLGDEILELRSSINQQEVKTARCQLN